MLYYHNDDERRMKFTDDRDCLPADAHHLQIGSIPSEWLPDAIIRLATGRTTPLLVEVETTDGYASIRLPATA